MQHLKTRLKENSLWLHMIAATAFMLIYIFTAAAGNTGLYADGALSMYVIARDRGWMFIEYTGQSEVILMQMFAALYLNLGGGSLALAIKLYTFGCVFWKVFFLGGALYICAKRANGLLFHMTAITMSLNFIATGIFSIMYYMMGCSMFWCAAVCWLYYDPQENRRVWNIPLLLLSVLIVFGDPSFVLFAPMLIIFIAYRLISRQIPVNLYTALSLILYIISFSLNLRAILFPRDPNNRAGFIATLQYIHTSFWITLAVLIAVFAICFFLREKNAPSSDLKRTGKRKKAADVRVLRRNNILFTFSIVIQSLFGLVALWYLMSNTSAMASRSYGSRVLNLIIPAFMAICVFASLALRLKIPAKTLAPLSLSLLVAAGVYNTASAFQYGEYLNTLYEETRAAQGFQLASETQSGGSPYCLTWSLPLDSVYAHILNGQNTINSVIIPDITYWEPFDSRNIKEYPDYRNYGITYNDNIW